MPRSLAVEIAQLGHTAVDVRDIGLRGRPDDEVFEAAIQADAVIITRDRGFALEGNWPSLFKAGVVLVNLPESTPGQVINARIISLLKARPAESLRGKITVLEGRRALSRRVRQRP